MVTPIGIPDDWEDNNLILFEEFCELIRTPPRTVRDWKRRGVGPRWTRFQGVSAGSTSPSPKPADSSPRPPSRGRRCVPMAERRSIPVYLSLEEAAEAMSVSVKTIRRWIAAGTLPAYRCGKRAIRIRLEDLEAAPRQIPSARW
jgi:excisionase family DNA binding protein